MSRGCPAVLAGIVCKEAVFTAVRELLLSAEWLFLLIAGDSFLHDQSHSGLCLGEGHHHCTTGAYLIAFESLSC